MPFTRYRCLAKCDGVAIDWPRAVTLYVLNDTSYLPGSQTVPLKAQCTVKLTIVICTHNPRPHYLDKTLDALRSQTLSKSEWELLVIDNASNIPVADKWDISWHPNGRHVSEPQLGVAFARRRGINEAATKLIVFVDDDNILDASYLAEAATISRRYPFIGTWGAGIIIGEYETEPASEYAELLPYLAIRNDPGPYWSNVYPCVPATPWGAGLCIRTEVARTYCRMCDDSEIVITSRRGSELVTGEDNEMAYTACEIGLGCGVFPQLRLTHLIPKERVTREYLLRLCKGTHKSLALVEYKWLGKLPASPLSLRGFLSVLKNAVLRQGIARRIYFAKLSGLITARRIIEDTARSAKPLRSRMAMYHPSQKKNATPRSVEAKRAANEQSNSESS
jgi:glycosyltransferase involved in cell wall biosynthesis